MKTLILFIVMHNIKSLSIVNGIIILIVFALSFDSSNKLIIKALNVYHVCENNTTERYEKTNILIRLEKH